MKKLFIFVFAVALSFSSMGIARAGLTGFNIGTDHFVYDSNQNITWYDYTYQRTNWNDANNWANTLTIGSVSSWSLWTAKDGPVGESIEYRQADGGIVIAAGVDGTTTRGFNITTNYMGYLYYVELGNKGYLGTDGMFQPDYGPLNIGPFANMMTSGYWSGTESTYDVGNVFAFDIITGNLVTNSIDPHLNNTQYAMAIHEGDIRTAVPEPTIMLLLGLGLMGLAGVRRFRK